MIENYTKLTYKEIIEKLSKELSKERFEHSVGTAEEAEKLAKSLNLNPEKAYVAGLLHDCAKCYDIEKLKNLTKYYSVCEDEIDNCKTLHAPISAYIAETEYGVSDEEILSAIRWHTIGKCRMTDFEKIIFIADKTEEKTREDELKIPIKSAYLSCNSLDRAMLESFRITIKSLVDRNLPICTRTIDVYNDLLTNCTKNK